VATAGSSKDLAQDGCGGARFAGGQGVSAVLCCLAVRICLFCAVCGKGDATRENVGLEELICCVGVVSFRLFFI
jgi:hypothetical protein